MLVNMVSTRCICQCCIARRDGPQFDPEIEHCSKFLALSLLVCDAIKDRKAQT